MIKRIFDIACSVIGLLILSPLFLLFAICIKLENPGPIFFRQERVGLTGKIFRIHKFRTMHLRINDKDELTSGNEDNRITRLGHIIRKLHMDELIQLIDVLHGDMSIVGPRPETPQYTKHHKSDWKKVLKVRPGITGLGSIFYAKKEYELLSNARDKSGTYIKQILPKKLRYEKFYIRNQSFCFDMKIIFWTVLYYINLFHHHES